jgi:hypothetical protein
MYKYKPTGLEKEYRSRQCEIRYSIDQGQCQVCGLPRKTIAHRICKSDVNIKKYGWDVIYHNFNLAVACNDDHNASFNIGMKDIKCQKLIELIDKRGDEELTSKFITRYINE